MEKLFYNGIILTMESQTMPEGVLVRDDTISKIGDLEVLRALAPNAKEIDLKEQTMLPAFIDAHGHFSSYANAQLQLSLDAITSFAELETRIRTFLKTADIPLNGWIVATGYDHNNFIEKCHPDRLFLDELVYDHPMILQHQSGHCGVFNTMALALLGIVVDTKDPQGGLIGRKNGALTGYLEESAYIMYMKQVPPSDGNALLRAYQKAQSKYFAYGISTVQEGMMVAQMLPLYQMLINSKLLVMDVVGYPDFDSMDEFIKAFPYAKKAYDCHFKIGGYKIVLDGSPQMRTAWMKSPYLGESDYCGYAAMKDVDVLKAVAIANKEDFQILAHCNGDGATQQFIDTVRQVSVDCPSILMQRPVIIHSQLINLEQLKEVAKLHMIPSFFVAHVLYFGDIHINNFGMQRARIISPAHTALKNDITFTFHQDEPVIEPNMLQTIQCAVTRHTKNGIILGEEECIAVMEALKAVTINAAYQYFEEDIKGSIKEGKRADFVILSDNPLTIAKDQIAQIKVLETIISGESVFVM